MLSDLKTRYNNKVFWKNKQENTTATQTKNLNIN